MRSSCNSLAALLLNIVCFFVSCIALCAKKETSARARVLFILLRILLLTLLVWCFVAFYLLYNIPRARAFDSLCSKKQNCGEVICGQFLIYVFFQKIYRHDARYRGGGKKGDLKKNNYIACISGSNGIFRMSRTLSVEPSSLLKKKKRKN